MIDWKQANPKGHFYSANGMYEVTQEKIWTARQFGNLIGAATTADEAKRARTPTVHANDRRHRHAEHHGLRRSHRGGHPRQPADRQPALA
jgi:hypothetical protein